MWAVASAAAAAVVVVSCVVVSCAVVSCVVALVPSYLPVLVVIVWTLLSSCLGHPHSILLENLSY